MIDPALGLVVLAEFHLAVDLRDDRKVLRTARLEQFGDTRQTARDVARFRGFPRNTGDNVAGLDVLAVFDGQNGVGGHVIVRGQTARQRNHLAFFIEQGDRSPGFLPD